MLGFESHIEDAAKAESTGDSRRPREALVISYHVEPDPAVGGLRPATFVRTLREAGWRVTIITRAVPNAREYWSRDDGVTLLTVPDTPHLTDMLVRAVRAVERSFRRGSSATNEPVAADSRGDEPSGSPARETLLERLERYFHAACWLVDRNKLWSTIALVRAMLLRTRFDVVLSSGPPMSPHIAASLAARCKGAAHVLDLRDPWVSDMEEPPEIHAEWLDGLNARLYRLCFARARVVLGASPGIVRISRELSGGCATPVHLVMNGFSGEPRVRVDQPAGRLHLLYTGTLYLNRNPFQLLEPVDWLIRSGQVDPEAIRITFVGGCESWNGIDLRSWASGKAVASVLDLRSFVPRNELPAIAASANVYVNFAQGQPLQIPAKTFEYLGEGVEMLVLAEEGSDTARLVREAGGGLCVDGSCAEAVAAAILDLYRRYVTGGGGYRFDVETRRRFSRTAQNALFLSIVQDLVEPDSGSRDIDQPA